jgi:Tol biopolymer transport system component
MFRIGDPGALTQLAAIVLLLMQGVQGSGNVDYEGMASYVVRAAFVGSERDALTGRIAFAAPSPDGTNMDIYVMNADGSGRTRLTTSLGEDYDMDWSPDGTQIVFRSDRDGYDALYIMDADGTNEREFMPDLSEQKRSPAWSPDGTQIAFAAYVPDSPTAQNIHIADVDGGNRRQLTQFRFPSFAEYPSWSPDGQRLAFLAADLGIKQVYVIDADGTNQVQLTQGGLDNDYPDWSPDGTRIAFKSERDGNREIYVMNADGTEQTNLTNSPQTEDTYPEWSPDGTRILYMSDADGNTRMYVINTDGTGRTWLADGIMPAWNGD